jgi:hypothetical protein
MGARVDITASAPTAIRTRARRGRIFIARMGIVAVMFMSALPNEFAGAIAVGNRAYAMRVQTRRSRGKSARITLSDGKSSPEKKTPFDTFTVNG